MSWRYAVLYPSDSGWAWTSHILFGVTALDRIKIILNRSGVKYLDRFHDIAWPEEPQDDEQILLIKGGFFWKPELLQWLDEVLDRKDILCVKLPGGEIFLASCSYGLWRKKYASFDSFPECHEDADLQGVSSVISPPSDLLPVPYWSEEGILELAGKPSDRPHVVWVRRKLLPFLKFCTERNISPNAITWLGFAVHMLGCFLLLPKSYFVGLLASIILIFSWVLDCADGSLARVAMKESPYGKKLDTVLGNISNIALFMALIIREYGHKPVLAVLLSFAILTGVWIAYTVHERIPKVAPSTTSSRLSNILTKINHRDYTIVLFLLAIFDAFKLFIWISLIGVHVYWIVDLMTKRKSISDVILEFKRIFPAR